MDSGCHTTVELTDDGVIFKRGKNDLMIHKALRGETKVLYSKIQEIKFKEASLTSTGYLQLSTPRSSMVGILWTECVLYLVILWIIPKRILSYKNINNIINLLINTHIGGRIWKRF